MKNIKRLEPMAYPLDPIPDDEPAWRDRPTVPGDYAWRSFFSYISADQIQKVWDVRNGRVYGPIPPDTKDGE